VRTLVTDGSQRPALAIARSLGARGLQVLVGADTATSLASSSKYCTAHVTYPAPERDQKSFERFVLGLARRGQVDVILPVTDVTMHAIASNQDALRHHCALACPPFSAFEITTDKWSLVERAAACGVPVPRTWLVDGLRDLRSSAAAIEAPVVVKPTRSRVKTSDGWMATDVHYARSREELWRLYEETDYLARHRSLIQQRIVGPGLAIFVLFDHGELLTAFAHRRIREKPPSGGASVLSESVAVDPRLREFAVRLLGPLGWHGVAMLECKQDQKSGEVFLIEVNGRFWGSLQLAIAAGVDFPFLAYQLAVGERPSVPPAYRIGVRNRWLLGDLDHLLIRLAHDAKALKLPDTAPSKVRAIVEFLRFVEPGLSYEILSADDPAPFLHEISEYCRALARHTAQRISGRLPWTRATARATVPVVGTAIDATGPARDADRLASES
jgi:predicted ATP-grasp superfamily ATP-dependent carboligase